MKLRRSRTDKQLAGVCGGLAKYFGIPSNRLRWITAFAIGLSGGVVFWVYWFLWAVIPLEEDTTMKDDHST